MAIHDLSGHCPKCEEIFNRYPGFNDELKTWFQAIQIENPEAHISCAGRGKSDQLMLFNENRSKATWRESAHNWNSAIDVFQLKNGQAVYDMKWFKRVMASALYPALNWYGRQDAPYYELPHFEIKEWNQLAKDGILKLVESI